MLFKQHSHQGRPANRVQKATCAISIRTQHFAGNFIACDHSLARGLQRGVRVADQAAIGRFDLKRISKVPLFDLRRQRGLDHGFNAALGGNGLRVVGGIGAHIGGGA